MVTEQKIYNAALTRYRLGNVLIWLGVLVWVPFIILRIAGEQPLMTWYLLLHLAGVIGGSRLRTFARKELGILPPKKSRLRSLGHGLTFAGTLVWVPYYYLKVVAQQPVDVMNYLPYHLVGVFGGLLILIISALISKKENTKEIS